MLFVDDFAREKFRIDQISDDAIYVCSWINDLTLLQGIPRGSDGLTLNRTDRRVCKVCALPDFGRDGISQFRFVARICLASLW